MSTPWAGSRSVAGGAGLEAVQALFGHVSIILTADTCTSVLPDLARATAGAVAAQITKAAGHLPALQRPARAPPGPRTPAA